MSNAPSIEAISSRSASVSADSVVGRDVERHVPFPDEFGDLVPFYSPVIDSTASSWPKAMRSSPTASVDVDPELVGELEDLALPDVDLTTESPGCSRRIRFSRWILSSSSAADGSGAAAARPARRSDPTTRDRLGDQAEP
jgi:hypothetical protein